MSRTKNTLKNTASGFVFKILNMILHFTSRTVFIVYLGNEFLSINGLLTSIFSFLNITELGIGGAIIYAMYEPIAKGDYEKIKQFIAYYKKIFCNIGLVVIGIGLALLPFLNMLVPPESTSINVFLVYVLFVANSASSYYFYVWRYGFICAMQQEYRLTLINCSAQITTICMQIAVLVLFKNFYLYLAIPIAVMIIQRIAYGFYIGKWYPYIKEKAIGKLKKEEKKPIYKNTFGLAIWKISAIFNNAIDNIVITAVIGLTMVGPYSNYLVLITMISGFASIVFVSARPSVGNLNASSTIEHKKSIFDNLNLLSFWIYGLCATCYICLIQIFIPIWIGSSYLMSFPFAIMVTLNFVVVGFNAAVSIYREGCGLYYEGRYRPIFTALLNIVLSIIFGKLWGTTGIISATTVSILLTTIWFDAYIVFKHVFKERVCGYLLRYLMELIELTIICIVALGLGSSIPLDNIGGMVIKGFVAVVVFNIGFWVRYRKSIAFRNLKQTVYLMLKINKHD